MNEQELDQWFQRTWAEHLADLEETALRDFREHSRGEREVDMAVDFLVSDLDETYLIEHDETLGGYREARAASEAAWAAMSLDEKKAYFRDQGADGSADPAEPPTEESGGSWTAGAFAVDMTLPDGSKYTESDAGATIGGVPVDTDSGDEAPPWWRSPRGVAGIGAASLAGLLLIVLISLSGGSDDNDEPTAQSEPSPASTVAAPTTLVSTTLAPETTTAITTTLAPSTTVAPTTTEAGPRKADPPSGADALPASTIRLFWVTNEGRVEFYTEVFGDGRSLAESESTKSYQPIANFDSCDGAPYEVRGDWGRGKPFEGKVFDENFDRVDGVAVEGEWTSDNEFTMSVDGLLSDSCQLEAVEFEIGVRVEDEDGVNADFGDRILWPTCCSEN